MRKAELKRNTKETQIEMYFDIDGTGSSEIYTGIGFLDHMLDLFARHGLFDLKVKCTGDLNVDAHHTVEDIGIVLGQAIKKSLGEKKGIKRYGSMLLPMDEVLAMVALDLGGRPFFRFDACFDGATLGQMDGQLIEEFFRSVAFNAQMNLNIKIKDAGNYHHMAEAIFKAFAKALDTATMIDDRICGVMSTKGSI